MGTTAEKLQAALDSKNDVQDALNEQGVEATEDFSTYGNLIRTELTNREAVEAHINDTRAHSPILVNITSTDGVAYTGTIDNLTELYAGLSITVIPNKASTSADCTLNLNSFGAKNIKHTSTVNNATLTTPGHVDWMSINAPCTMTYDGTQWVASSIFGAAPAPLYVTMTGNEEDGYSVDKTFEEIFNAFIQDRVVRLLGQGRYGYEEYQCVYSESGMLAFTYQLNETLKKVYITSDNTVGYVEDIIFSESNPPTAEQVKAVGWENVNLSTGSVKTWSLNQNAPTSISVTNNVTDMPEDDKFWIVKLTIAKAGTWRKLTATEITDGTTLPKSYECICKEGTWSGWSAMYSAGNPPTAEQVGALPLTGGTLSGNVTIEKSNPRQLLINSDISRRALIEMASGGAVTIANYPADSTTGVYLALFSEASGVNLNKLLRVFSKESGSTVVYDIFGQHNKPTGSYTGNGSATSRTVSVGGIGNCLLIRSGKESGTVVLVNGSMGGIGKIASTPKAFTSDSVSYTDGVLTIASTDDCLNLNGMTYYYQVL